MAEVTPDKTRVLIVDDDAYDRDYLAGRIESWGFLIQSAVDGHAALGQALEFLPDVVVSDLRMPNMDGMGLIQGLRDHHTPAPVILLSQVKDINTAVSAVRDGGAYWFLEKPAPLEALRELLIRAAEHGQLKEENERLRSAARARGIGDLVGGSPAMQQLFGLIARVAATSATVLITGESGSGKEVVAQAIHGASPRHDKPFVAVNCAALPESLIENELFGHERGAFTGASDRQIGRIESAHGGTLFLDEIGELPPSMQAKLLRVLEENRLRRLGGKSDIEVDARIIAATNRSPEKALADGNLREDLFYRLNVFHFRLPPLRERKEDIPMLAEALIESLSRRHSRGGLPLDQNVLQSLIDYDWPGNVRELRNVLERALILAGERTIAVSDLPGNLRPKNVIPSLWTALNSTEPRVVLPVGVSLRAAERALIEATLAKTDGNRRKAARILGVSLKTIHTKLKQYRADQPEGSEQNGS